MEIAFQTPASSEGPFNGFCMSIRWSNKAGAALQNAGVFITEFPAQQYQSRAY